MPTSTHVLALAQWYNDVDTQTLKLGDGVKTIDELENLWPSDELPPSDNHMYGMMNGEYQKILPVSVTTDDDE